MIRRRANKTVLLAAMTALTVCGCEQRPATNTDEILYYVRNGDAGAKVRRLDAEAQTYVDAIFHAYRAWNTANAPIYELDDLDALWALDADEWRSEKDRGARLKAIRKWKADEPDAEQKDAKTRAAWIEELAGAVSAVPSVPVGAVTDLAAAIEEELSTAYDAERTAWLADRYEALLSLAADNADGFDANGKGLAFEQPEITQRAASIWDELHRDFSDARQSEREYIERTLGPDLEANAAVVAEKQGLRKAGLSTEADHRRYNELEMAIHYFDARKKNAEKRKRVIDAKSADGK